MAVRDENGTVVGDFLVGLTSGRMCDPDNATWAYFTDLSDKVRVTAAAACACTSACSVGDRASKACWEVWPVQRGWRLATRAAPLTRPPRLPDLPSLPTVHPEPDSGVDEPKVGPGNVPISATHGCGEP